MQRQIDRNLQATTTQRSTVEHVSGTRKHWIDAMHFLTRMRGRESPEMSLHVLAFNLERVMNMLVVAKTIKAMKMDESRSHKRHSCAHRDRLPSDLAKHGRAVPANSPPHQQSRFLRLFGTFRTSPSVPRCKGR
jgi:hypothetical protein